MVFGKKLTRKGVNFSRVFSSSLRPWKMIDLPGRPGKIRIMHRLITLITRYKESCNNKPARTLSTLDQWIKLREAML